MKILPIKKRAFLERFPALRGCLIAPVVRAVVVVIPQTPDATVTFGRQFQNGRQVHWIRSFLVSIKFTLVHDPRCTALSK